MTTLTLMVRMVPPHELSPNRSRELRYRTLGRIKAGWAEAWWAAAIDASQGIGRLAGPGHPPVFAGPVRCRITVHLPKRGRRWDGDNALAAMKWGIDVLARTSIVADDRQIAYEPIAWDRDPAGTGFCEVVLEAIEEDR